MEQALILPVDTSAFKHEAAQADAESRYNIPIYIPWFSGWGQWDSRGLPAL